MKKQLFILALSALACICSAQSYDNLKKIICTESFINDTCRIVNSVKVDELKVYIDRSIEYGSWKKASTGNVLWDLNNNNEQFVALRTSTEKIVLPKVIYDEYMFGRRLTKAGVVTLSVSVPLSIIGVVCARNQNPNTRIAGYSMLGVGSAAFSCSIPLLCFGDHLKRTANKDYILHMYF